MKCRECGEAAAGACTACGAFWCARHRRSWFGQALCAWCYAKTVRMQAVCGALFVLFTVVCLMWVLAGR